MPNDVTIQSTFPVEAAKYLVDVLRGKIPFDRWIALANGLKVSTFLLELATNTASIMSKPIKPKKLSKARIADAIEECIPVPGKSSVKAFPLWLLPIIINLVAKWILDGKKA